VFLAARHACIDLLRKQQTRGEALDHLSQEVNAESSASLTEEAIDAGIWDVRCALLRIAPSCRTLLRKHYYDEKSWAELDTELFDGRQSSRNRTLHCLKKMMTLLRGWKRCDSVGSIKQRRGAI